MGSSFCQDRFLGGEWSPHAQGRVNDPNYKQAMNICLNGYPTEEGAWIRREGFRYLAHTRGGAKGVLRAFDFSTTQPYQLEFTAGYVRFFAGLGQVTDANGEIEVETVTTETHARLVLAQDMSALWANGDRVRFTLETIPCSGPLLCGREFILADEDATTFSYTLKDGLTGAYVNGATIGYNFIGTGTPDTVAKIFELATPYTITDLDDLRTVQDETTVLVLHGSYNPRVIYEAAPFTIAAANFVDGPYLDINNTATTITPSGVSGSVTLTASSIVGINGGTGFQTTDIGRLVRLQAAPAAWANGTTYAKAANVTGSDGNVYTSVAGANLAHNPTTDDGTYWEISAAQVLWTWAKITARTDTTHVTATIMGDNLPAATATAVWRLGLYSDTTGWPKCGEYHEGRLWLSGVVGNRVDAGTSNNRDPETGEAMAVGSYCFAPTSNDGTVADNNAIAATFNSKEVNAIFWMRTSEDGLMCGTEGGEWRIKASSLDDPLSPSTVQARRVSTYGAANVDPVNASRMIFVQARGRKLLAMEQISANKYFGDNVSHLADHLISAGVEEITWQQEPSLVLWSRLADGGLVGCVYQKEESKEDSFQAFYQVTHGGTRSFTSISGGPSYDGFSNALYAITNQTDSDEPDYNVYWVEYSMPRFDAAVEDWSAYFVDGGANPCCAQVFAISNGDSFDGVRIYGLYHLNGKTIQPVLGGLDLGDRSVAGGYVDIAFGTDPDSKFTLAFFQGLSDGTDYGVYQLEATFAATLTPVIPPVPSDRMTSEIGANTAVISGSYNGISHLDPSNDLIYQIQGRSGSILPGIRVLTATTGVEARQSDPRTMYGPPVSGGAFNIATTYSATDVVTGSDAIIYSSLAGSNTGNDPVTDGEVHWTKHSGLYNFQASGVSFLHPDGNIYIWADATNKSRLIKIRASDLTFQAIFGVTSSSTSGSDAFGLQLGFRTMASIRVLEPNNTYGNYLVSCGILSAGKAQEIAIMETNLLVFFDKFVPGQDYMVVTSGYTKLGHGSAYALGKEAYSSDSATAIKFYEILVSADLADGHRTIASFTPAQIDVTWTLFHDVSCPAYDQIGHALIFFAQSPAGPTNTGYLIKLDIGSGAIVWKTPVVLGTTSKPTDQEMSVTKIPAQRFCWWHADNLYMVDTTTGVITTQETNHGISLTGASYYEDNSSSITFFGSFTASGSGPAVTYGNATHTLTNQWGRYYFGLSQAQQDSITTYEVPCSIGFTYTSRGQLLRPDYGVDAGARNGPAFGKKRRVHKYAAAFYRTRSISFGTEFGKLKPVKLADDGKSVTAAPALYSGIAFDTIVNDYSRNGGQIAWEITRPYPVTVLTIGGYMEATDE